MDSLNWLAIGAGTIVTFVLGHVWYGFIFGKLWMKIHHGDATFTDEQMQEMMQGMWKIMLAEIVSTALIIISLACIMKAIPEYSWYQNSIMIWAGLLLPMSISNIIWGNDKKEWMLAKIAVSSSYRLVTLLIAGYILFIW